MREFLGIQYMRALTPIYSHRFPRFKETQIEFDPNQKRNPNLKGKPKRVCRSTGRSTDPCHGRPRRSTGPNREQPAFSRSTGPVDRSLPRLTGPVDRSLPRSTGLTLCMSCTPVDRAADREHNLACSNALFLAP